MRIEVFDTLDAVGAAAADLVAEHAHAAVEDRGVFTLALSRATPPPPLLEQLAKRDVAWSQVHLFQVDERAVQERSPERNFTVIREHLLTHVKLPAANLHPMPVGLASLEEAAARYGQTLVAVCGAPPVLDLVHLRLGPDGHTASLFPADPALEVKDAPVAAVGEHGGRRRLTLTVPTINAARQRVWVVTGPERAAALRRLVEGADIPASRVRRDDAVVFADQAAARLVT